MNINIKEAAQGAQYASQAMHVIRTATRTKSQSASSEGSFSAPSLVAPFFAIFTGVLSMISGVFGALSIYPKCIVAGAMTTFFGFLLIMLEVPICCPFVKYTQTVTKFSQSRSAWEKALLYMIPPLLPLILCQSVSIFFGCVLLLINGLVQVKVAMNRKPASTDDAEAQVEDKNNLKTPSNSGLTGSLMTAPESSTSKGFSFDQLP